MIREKLDNTGVPGPEFRTRDRRDIGSIQDSRSRENPEIEEDFMFFLDNNEKPAKCIKIPIIRKKDPKKKLSHVYSSSFTQQTGTENSKFTREFPNFKSLQD